MIRYESALEQSLGREVIPENSARRKPDVKVKIDNNNRLISSLRITY
jgi:hypothetical protein